MAVQNPHILRKSIILLAALLGLLSGCSRPETTQTPSAATVETAATAETLPVETEPTQNKTQATLPVPEETLAYEEGRLENGDKTLNRMNHHNAEVHCYYPIFSGSEAAEVINADVLRIAETFTYQVYTRDQIREMHYAFGMPFAYSHIGYLTPTYQGHGTVSILLSYGSFWGEDDTYDHSFAGYTYSLTTGERLTLAQLTGLPEDQLLRILLTKTREILKDRYAKLEVSDRSWVRPEELKLEDFGFYITEDRQIYATINGIHMRQEEPARGYWISERFPTGLSIAYPGYTK